MVIIFVTFSTPRLTARKRRVCGLVGFYIVKVRSPSVNCVFHYFSCHCKCFLKNLRVHLMPNALSPFIVNRWIGGVVVCGAV